VRYTPPPFPDPELLLRLRKLITCLKPSIVYSYGWLTYSVVPALWRTDIPLVLSARDYGNVCAVRTLVHHSPTGEDRCDGPSFGKCMNCAGIFYGRVKGAAAVLGVLGGRRLLRRRVKALHSCSTFTDGVLRRYLLPEQVPGVVLPDFREDELDGTPSAQIMAQLPNNPYILFVGAYRRIKGDQLVIDAFRRLRTDTPLVLIGGRSAEPLPMAGDGITILCDVPHATVMAAWDNALFGVCPSIWPEPLGNVVHEAMSRGKPVIGTRQSGHTDIIRHGRNGLLVPPNDVDALVVAMNTLLSNATATEEMGRLARVDAAAFTADAVVPRYEAFLTTFAKHTAPNSR
jgi:glycosyltransferase involved in cell wall biosynthesis